MNLTNRDKCTGCGACAAICGKHAIIMSEDDEGFLSPSIKSDLCVECGQCANVCPSLNPSHHEPIRHAYAVQNMDSKTLAVSTSGGAFTAIAKYVLNMNGVVYGCVWDDEYNAMFTKAESEDELLPMRGSKYVSSYAGNVFSEIKAILSGGRKVLFAGLTCQVAGLINYLGDNNENLYTVGLLCGGVPSPYAFKEYLKTIDEGSLKDLDFKFRDKSKKGWGVHISYNNKCRRVYQSPYWNSYFSAYNEKVFHRRCCFDCDYRYMNRVEDITIGDFWGVQKYHSDYVFNKGVSAIIISTEKGEQVFDAISEQLDWKETQLEYIAAENNLSIGLRQSNGTISIPENRDYLFKLLREKGWKGIKRHLYTKKRLRLMAVNVLPDPLQEIIRNLKRRIRR